MFPDFLGLWGDEGPGSRFSAPRFCCPEKQESRFSLKARMQSDLGFGVEVGRSERFRSTAQLRREETSKGEKEAKADFQDGPRS